MNTNNTANGYSSLNAFGDEMMTSSGVRAVSAWVALCEPEETSYDIEDEEAPYELRSAVGTNIGWEAAWEGLDPQGDVPRYLDYMDLFNVYGPEWPIPALIDYLDVKGMEPEHAEATAQTIWRLALEAYETARDLQLRIEQEEEEQAELAA
ncbi:TPA: hypothetical protein ACV5G7_000658 [Pseudomonas aeruginosa]